MRGHSGRLYLLWRGSLVDIMVCRQPGNCPAATPPHPPPHPHPHPGSTAPCPSCLQQRLRWSVREVCAAVLPTSSAPSLATSAPPPPPTGHTGKRTFCFHFSLPLYSGPLSPQGDCVTSESQWKAQGSQKTPSCPTGGNSVEKTDLSKEGNRTNNMLVIVARPQAFLPG